MRATHYARQLVAAGVALAIAACGGGDSNGPAEFNAQGTTADMSAAKSAFQAQQVSSFAVLSPGISTVLNGSAVVKSSALAVRGTNAARAARELATIVPKSGAAQAAV